VAAVVSVVEEAPSPLASPEVVAVAGGSVLDGPAPTVVAVVDVGFFPAAVEVVVAALPVFLSRLMPAFAPVAVVTVLITVSCTMVLPSPEVASA
jgi:hypothetical protein